jgi:hypothetical protein
MTPLPIFVPVARASLIALAFKMHVVLLNKVGGSSLLGMGALFPAERTVRQRGRRSEPKLPIEATHPQAASALRQMQRDARTRLLSTAVGDAAMAFEDGVDGNLLLHYISPLGSITLAGGWLGAGRRKYIWVPLRPTVAWNSDSEEGSVSLLSPSEIATLAADLHTGLTALAQRHVIEEFLAPNPIPLAERQAIFDRYTALLNSHGWIVNIDPASSRRSLKRTPNSESANEWPQADREELARLEALVAETLKGVRTSSRVLHQDK